MRREWIEIDKEEKENDDQNVSLHAEGVDCNVAREPVPNSFQTVSLHAEGVD